MHILLIHQAFAAVNEPGGTRHHELALYLAEQGHCVTIIASPVSYLTGKSVRTEIADGGHERVKIIRPPVYQALHRSFSHRVINFLSFMVTSFAAGFRVEDVDLVWGTSPPIFQGITAWGIARLKRAAFLFEVRDLWPAFAVAVGVLKNKALIWASERMENFLYRKADVLIVNSPGFIDHVESRCNKRVQLVPNGVDANMFHPEDDGMAFRREHHLENKFVVLYAGAHGFSNDLGAILEAANTLRDKDEIQFAFLGDGKEKVNLQAQAKQMGLENVRFLPPVPKDVMSSALAASDVCIAILKPIEMYKTVYPNKVFDYMAAGRCVILAIDGVIREVVEDAQAGVFVQPGKSQQISEAIWDLYAEPIKRKRMGQNGRQYVEENFDRSALAEKFSGIISEMVNQEDSHA